MPPKTFYLPDFSLAAPPDELDFTPRPARENLQLPRFRAASALGHEELLSAPRTSPPASRESRSLIVSVLTLQ